MSGLRGGEVPPWDPPGLEAAVRALGDALDGGLPPCAADPEGWLSPAGVHGVARAVDGCMGCRGLLACAAYARVVRPSVGVWAGEVVSPRGARPDWGWVA